MKLGAIIPWTDGLAEFRRMIRLADELGYDVIGIGDTPARAYEMYVSLTVAAHESRTAMLTPMVTTPYLRHPSATATAITALSEVAPGRVMLGIGNGGSAARITGKWHGATQEVLRDYIEALRVILAGGSAHYEGRDTEPLTRVTPMPIFVAADYPKSLRLAGELADGVVITVGMSIERAEKKVAIVRTAASAAGRDPDSVDIWGFSFMCVHDSREQANHEIRSALASNVGLRLRAPHMRATVPPELLGAVEEMERRYDVLDHVFGGYNANLVEELGLIDFAASMTAVTGNVAEVADHLKQLETIGISCMQVPLLVLADPERTLRGLRDAASYT